MKSFTKEYESMSKISRLEDGTAGTDRGWTTTPPHNKLSGGRLSRFSFLLSEQKMTVMITLGLFFLVLSFSLAISIGAISVPAQTVWGIVLNKISPDTIEQTWSKGREAIVWDIRFPRAILAGFVGAGLAIVGATLQAVTRNPLADPHLLGISSGAAFGAICRPVTTQACFWGWQQFRFLPLLVRWLHRVLCYWYRV